MKISVSIFTNIMLVHMFRKNLVDNLWTVSESVSKARLKTIYQLSIINISINKYNISLT